MFDPAVGSISFELWQKATDSSGNVVDEAKALNELFTIEAPSWTKQIDVTDLPTVGTTTDGQEVSYTYFVKEDAVSGFDTVYENNGGITDSDVDGTIVIKNKQQKSYELPMTGGRGTIGYTMAGGAMILLAVCLYIQNKRQGGLA
jgi:LPXTG-motif cell wall-anchored protein